MSLGPVMAAALGFCVLVVPLAWLWRRRFSRGPAEQLMRRLSGPTPPRVAEVARRRAPALPRWVWAVVAAGALVVLALRLVGTHGAWGCPPPTEVVGAVPGQLTLSCRRREHLLSVRERADVTLETHSGHDLFLELHEGERRLAQNDDAGEGLNARLVATLAPGRYRVVVRPYSHALGGYALSRGDGPESEEREGCTNRCASAHDDECDDGGPGSLYDVCALGTDCADCGPR